MSKVKANGLDLEYLSEGPDDGKPLLLIMGLAGQLTLWPQGLCDRLVDKGYRVIRYDARDCGLSQKMEDSTPVDFPAIMGALAQGQKPDVPYSLDDMADDAVGLLDALGIDKAHVVGGSMGGMVAQLVAADHPERVLSLTSVMTTSGNPDLPGPDPEMIAKLSAPPPDPQTDREGWISHMISSTRITQSPAYPDTDESLRAIYERDLDRSYYPHGFGRHYAAVLAAPDRRPKLAGITAPTLVIHGEEDPLEPVARGRDTAANIPDAELLVIPGMGHDFPAALFDRIADAIDRNAARARSMDAAHR